MSCALLDESQTVFLKTSKSLSSQSYQTSPLTDITLCQPSDGYSESEINGVTFYSISETGDRFSNEDFHVTGRALEFSKQLPGDLLYTAIFDGHGGYECASFSSKVLPKSLFSFENLQKSREKSLFDSFLLTDKKWANFVQTTNAYTDAGSTALFALIENKRLIIANTGDSRAILLTSDGVRQISKDHSPSEQSERSRIENSGGNIIDDKGVDRVEGVLSLSRALGDLPLKKYVIPDPDLFSYDESASIWGMVLACDGLWGSLSNEEVQAFIEDSIKRGDIKRGLERLVNEAIERECYDNVTVTLVLFPGAEKAVMSKTNREVKVFTNNEANSNIDDVKTLSMCSIM